MKEFTYNGVWWLPESPSAQVAGSMQFSKDDGLQLSLYGVLGEYGAIVGKKAAPIILGCVWDCPLGQDTTLTGSWAKAVTFGSIGLTREKYHVERAFIGSHLGKDESFSFSRLEISTSGLSSWASTFTGLTHRVVPKSADHRVGFEIHWIAPEPISGKIPGGDLRLGLGASMPMEARDWSIKERIALSVAPEQPQSADALNGKYVHPLLNFLTLATDHPNALIDFRVRRLDSKNDIHVIASRVFEDAAAAEGLIRHNMIFSLDDVRDRTVEMMGLWIEVSERLSPVCNVYFGSLYQPDAFVEVRFTAVFQALEMYERTLPDSVSKGDLPGLRLREQFTRLIEDHKQAVSPLFGVDVAAAVAVLLDYRNEVVHGNTDLANQPGSSEKLFWWVHRLRFLMKACLLTELKVPAEEQLNFFRQNQMFIHIAGLAKER